MRCDRNISAGLLLHTVAHKTKVEASKEKHEYFYSHKIGHVIADCLMLKKKQQTSSAQPVGSVKTISAPVDSIYQPFLLEGFVSFSGQQDDQVEVRVLRDIGAARSFIRGDVLPFSEKSCLGSSILVKF